MPQGLMVAWHSSTPSSLWGKRIAPCWMRKPPALLLMRVPISLWPRGSQAMTPACLCDSREMRFSTAVWVEIRLPAQKAMAKSELMTSSRRGAQGLLLAVLCRPVSRRRWAVAPTSMVRCRSDAGQLLGGLQFVANQAIGCVWPSPVNDCFWPTSDLQRRSRSRRYKITATSPSTPRRRRSARYPPRACGSLRPSLHSLPPSFLPLQRTKPPSRPDPKAAHAGPLLRSRHR